MSEKVQIIPAKPSHKEDFQKIIKESAGNVISALFGADFIQNQLAELYSSPGNLFSYEYTNFLSIGEKIGGGVLAYTWLEKRKSEFSTGFKLVKSLRFKFLRLLPQLIRSSREMGSVREGELYISNLAIFREFRGRGLGKVLLKWCLSKASKERCEKIALDVEKKNIRAIKLYQKFGFSGEREFSVQTDKETFQFFRMIYRVKN